MFTAGTNSPPPSYCRRHKTEFSANQHLIIPNSHYMKTGIEHMKKQNLQFHLVQFIPKWNSFWFPKWHLGKISPNVYVHHPVVLIQGRGLDAAHGEDPRTVDQDVQPAEVSHSLLHCLLHRLLIGEVAGNK